VVIQFLEEQPPGVSRGATSAGTGAVTAVRRYYRIRRQSDWPTGPGPPIGPGREYLESSHHHVNGSRKGFRER
jgi:hypothetical protein